jgi:peptidoglycan-N-acetylmuramic acid deacetylase
MKGADLVGVIFMKARIASFFLIWFMIISALNVRPPEPPEPDMINIDIIRYDREVARFIEWKRNRGSYPPNPDDDIDPSGYSKKALSWSFRRMKDHKQSQSYAPFDINEFDAYFVNPYISEDKVVYLTFDCGYEYKNCTEKILDILLEKHVNAAFFVTKQFVKSDYALCVRMKNEGHIIGNHTMNHPNLAKCDDEKLNSEINGLDDYLYEKAGIHLDGFLRPPEGAFSEYTLAKTRQYGYKTIFWSIAYLDYDTSNQPGADYVLDHIKTYHHNGAIILMHAISESNVEALPEVIDYLLSQGYRFGTLNELGDR